MKLLNNLIGDKEALFASGKPSIVTFVNPYSYMIARKNKGIYSRFDYICADGILLSLFASVFFRRTKRLSFDMTSLAPVVFEHASINGLEVFFVGSTDESVNSAVTKISAQFPRMKISGARSGYFTGEERSLFINEMVRLQPKIVVVGMGAPLQEKLLVDLRDAGWLGTGFTCGGFIHQTAKAEGDYYPVFIDRFHLRWAYRIYDEPKLLTRYLFNYPAFVFCFIYDVFFLGKR